MKLTLTEVPAHLLIAKEAQERVLRFHDEARLTPKNA